MPKPDQIQLLQAIRSDPAVEVVFADAALDAAAWALWESLPDKEWSLSAAPRPAARPRARRQPCPLASNSSPVASTTGGTKCVFRSGLSTQVPSIKQNLDISAVLFTSGASRRNDSQQ